MARSARKTSLETRTARARLPQRRAPYFVKIAKGLRLGYYRGTACGTWIGRHYRGGSSYDTSALGLVDDLTDADGIKVLDFWQALEAARRWAERQRLIEEGIVRSGPYTVADAVKDYLDEIRAEKQPYAVRNAEYTFDAFVLPELGSVLLEKLTADRLVRWRNGLATRPKRVRTKLTADKQATRETPNDDDARRRRKATANRILTMLKAALNRAFQAGRAASDQAWRRVKPFAGRALFERRRSIPVSECMPAGPSAPGASRHPDWLPLLRTRAPAGKGLQSRQRDRFDSIEQGQGAPRHADGGGGTLP
jgi:hypothetical protein